MTCSTRQFTAHLDGHGHSPIPSSYQYANSTATFEFSSGNVVGGVVIVDGNGLVGGDIVDDQRTALCEAAVATSDDNKGRMQRLEIFHWFRRRV